MPLDKSSWPRLKPEAQKCLKKDGYTLEKKPEEGDYYIAVDLAGFEDVNKEKD